ncbi:MAG: Flp family type IVb pilin [Desulfuromonas sp.]|nr:MAG: Flp family type IVb pilin [Desulfuromonas sp.]
MRHLRTWTRDIVDSDSGASAVEYGVLIALIIAVCIGTILLLGDKVNLGIESFNEAWTKIQG